MIDNKHNPPMPPDWDDPSHIPHYPDWPNMPYADWPRSRFHRWNDSEPANVQPWWHDCCDGTENPCVCVTSADVDRWNTYSSLSGLVDFDASGISAGLASALSALDNMYDYDKVRDCYYTVSANSAVWNSAAYVPNIYDNLSALYSGLNTKLSGVWTDSRKIAHDSGAYGEFDGTIVGDGSYDRPLRVGANIAKAAAIVDLATDHFDKGLVNEDDVSAVQRDVETLGDNLNSVANEVSGNRAIIEWILNHLSGEWHWADLSASWRNERVSKETSRANPEVFYYWEDTKYKV